MGSNNRSFLYRRSLSEAQKENYLPAAFTGNSTVMAWVQSMMFNDTNQQLNPSNKVGMAFAMKIRMSSLLIS